MGLIQQLGWKIFMDRNNIFYSIYVPTHFWYSVERINC